METDRLRELGLLSLGRSPREFRCTQRRMMRTHTLSIPFPTVTANTSSPAEGLRSPELMWSQCGRMREEGWLLCLAI